MTLFPWLLEKLMIFSSNIPPIALHACVLVVKQFGVITMYQPYRLTYHKELSQSVRPTGRTLHQWKEKKKDKVMLELNHFLVFELNWKQNSS